MLRATILSAAFVGVSVGMLACSGATSTSGFATNDDAGTGGTGEGGAGGGGGGLGGGGGTATDGGGGGTTTATTTIYANTDDSLYTLDPATQKVTLLGKLQGGTGNFTDVAVNANGDVYVNTNTEVFKVTLPASGGTVATTKIATIAAKNGAVFFALAFAPAGVLGANEELVGGDAKGELWSIDTASGATKDLGSFGKDPSDATKVLALSGDLVFYTDATGKATGVATIRACATGGTSCSKTSDFLAGIDMAALSAAFTSGTPAASLLSGIYGGSSGKTGPGTSHGELFGLGAWNSEVFAFSRSGGTGSPPSLISIDTNTGVGTVLPGTFSFTNGWSGAGVSTKTTVTIPPPATVK